MRLGEKCAKVRECMLCGARSSFNVKKPPQGEPVILSVNMTLYRRGPAGGQLATCKRIQVCEADLRAMAASLQGQESLFSPYKALHAKQRAQFGAAIINALMDRYSGLVQAKSA